MVTTSLELLKFADSDDHVSTIQETFVLKYLDVLGRNHVGFALSFMKKSNYDYQTFCLGVNSY